MGYVTIAGRSLHYRETGRGPVALFVHGFPLDSRVWLDQLAGLASERRCVAVDLRGSGRSDPVAGSPLTMEQHAIDLGHLVEHLEVDRVDLIGLSMGGYVALAFAELHGEMLRSMALVDTRAEADSPEARTGRGAMAERLLAAGRTALGRELAGVLLGPTAPPQVEARLLTMVEATPYETILAALAGMQLRPDRTGLLGEIRVPAAVIVGEHDALTPPPEAERLAAGLGGADLVVVPGAGHLTPLEAPAAVTGALRRLFAKSPVR